MKKVISLLLLLTMLLPLCLTVFADEAEPAPTYEVSDSTSIAQDFQIAFGGKYKLEQFPPDSSIGDSEEDNDDIACISCVHMYNKNCSSFCAIDDHYIFYANLWCQTCEQHQLLEN